MNNNAEKIEMLNHSISIAERQSMQISGIVKIDSFDNEEFLLETSLGLLGIKGSNLEIVKLDTYEGTIMIRGVINTLSYLEDKDEKKENKMLARLFK